MLKVSLKMKKHSATLAVGGLIATALSGCGGGSSNNSSFSTVYGPDSAFGKGFVRAYVTQENNVPTEVGMEVTVAALASPASLPKPPAGQAAIEVTMQQPAIESSLTPFLSTTLFYSPGHPPEAQEVPHLHPTWFIVPDATRAQITPVNPASFLPPAAGELPTGFITPPSPDAAFIPSIGNIYFDPTEAGYNENPFSTALSEYRYFNTHVSAIALGTPNTFLQSKATLKRPLGVPAIYPTSGYYPTNYTIRFNPLRQTYVMALGGFVKRTAAK